MQSGVGFIPLGLGASQDLRDDTDTADCKVGENSDGKFTQTFAPQHSGISGYPYFGVAVALDAAGLIASEGAGNINLAGSIYRSPDQAPTSVTYPDFVGFMNVTWNANTKAMTSTAIDGASFYRVVFSVSDDESMRYHHIYWNNGTGFTLQLPAGVENRTAAGATGIAQAVKIDGTDYDGLVEFNSTNIDNMNDLVESFSMSYLAD